MSFTVYKSSAGSGKTFTLVKEYLKIALSDEQTPPQNYRRILAVTFTNKAAAEMKERVLSALKALSGDEAKKSSGSKTLEGILIGETQLDKKTLQERAQSVLQAILHNYSDFAIGTIDSFVHKIVRTFAFDLKIPINFDIETDANKLLSQAIDLLLSQIGNDEKLTRVLVEFTESKTDDEKSWHIENDLLEFASNLLKDDGTVHIGKLKSLTVDDFFQIRDTLREEIKKFENSLTIIASAALTLINKNGLAFDSFFQGGNGIGGYFKNISLAKFEKLTPNSYVTKTIEEDKWFSGKATQDEKSQIEVIKSSLTDAYRQMQVIVDDGNSEYILFQLINRNIYSLAVLNEIEKLLHEFKNNNNILHISEFNKIISKIILNQPVPFIYERLGEKYNNYLIDEFQDTSIMQWQNLMPLIDNALAENHFTMLVGDGKQAIYRWRGGEVEQFSKLPEVHEHNNNPFILEREETLKRNYQAKHLNKNFRSKKEIIEFNNSLFGTLSPNLHVAYQRIYEKLEQEADPENTGGYVSVEFLEAEGEVLRETFLQKTFSIIEQLLTDNFELKDIAVLVRKNSDGSEIAGYLNKKGIKVISSESLLLKNSGEVNFLQVVLKYLKDSNDNVSKTAIIQYLFDHGKIVQESFHDSVKKAVTASYKDFNNFLRQNKLELNRFVLLKLPLYELCEEIVRLFKLNSNPNPYVQFFLDEVLSYTTKYNNNLNDFLDWWENKKDKSSLVVPEGLNAVTIMSIHRSKGLEFPVVILPFANWRVSNGKDNLWINLENTKLSGLSSALIPMSPEMEKTDFSELYLEEKNKSLLDNLNVLYVALTRPEERLYVLSGKPGKTTEKMASISDMFAHYYQNNGQWQESKTCYEFGIPQRHDRKEKQSSPNLYNLSRFYSENWQDRINISRMAPEIWEPEIEKDKKEYGVMVHTALSKIKFHQDIDSAILSMSNEGLIDEEEKEELDKLLRGLMNNALIKSFFETDLNTRTEAEILLPDGSAYRPDRVIFKENATIIIDYKTGKELEKHKKQLNKYGVILSEMGYRNIEKYLIYIEDKRVEKV